MENNESHEDIIKRFQEEDAARQRQTLLDKENASVLWSQVEATERSREANQENCSHTKPNGRPAIAGQRIGTISATYAFVCLYCNKEFDIKTLPSHLRQPSQYIGGFVESRKLEWPTDTAWKKEYDEWQEWLKALPPEPGAEEIEAALNRIDDLERRIHEARYGIPKKTDL